ncbi:MAG TPA: LPS export ABC transporter periplasmic protein LptC [Longimicrobiales bacterium]|nr:LPS export ABC transporter periplasmic protein LptC [Longimicrobiales bacterium]
MTDRERERKRIVLRRGRRAGLVVLVLLLGGCGGEDEPPIAEAEIANMDADQVMFGVEHFITGNGVVRGVLLADTAFMYEDSALVRVRPVDLTLYNEQGEVAGEVTARSGVLNTRTQLMTATGDVVVQAEQSDERIETEELHFDPNRDRIWSVVATTIHRDGTVLRGTGFTSNTRLTDTRIDAPRGRVEGLEF